MVNDYYRIADLKYIAAGAAILASGGGGSYLDAVNIIKEFEATGWSGAIPVQEYDGATNCCVLAMMGSPDAAANMTLSDVNHSIANTISTFQQAAGFVLSCIIPVEIGAINTIVPFLAAAQADNSISWVVDGDGAGRAVPELPQTSYGGSLNLAVSPGSLANNAGTLTAIQSATLKAGSAAQMEALAGGITSAFGSFAGIALWPSNISNQYALSGNYIKNTVSQTRALGQFLLTATTPPPTAIVACKIADLTGRAAAPVLTNFYITAITQSTTSGSLDAGIIRLDNSPDQSKSTETHYLYNLNENLIMYSNLGSAPNIIAPDSICYYSESNGLGFSNATNDLTLYFNSKTGKSTGSTVSVIKVNAAPTLCKTPGVVASFAGLLRNIGYAGALPYPQELESGI
ncbi:MAG: hypothetical protein VR65_07495 [Desulfobulbaceae bacterium BRH_c16a]|nr:MAG: hypothetical protein VR65_07495 [Desulfobulbaceae bacterium BRH_c16a]